jgi:hypothetical protein
MKPPCSPNIRTNMRGERDFLVRSLSKTDLDSVGASRHATPKLQARPKPGRLPVTDRSSESEVEVVENYVPPPRQSQSYLTKRKIEEEPSSWLLATDGSSESELEVVENYVPPPRQSRSSLTKRTIKEEPSSRKCPRLSASQLVSKGAFTDPINIDYSSDSSTASNPSKIFLLPATPKSHLPSSSSEGSQEQGYPAPWPANSYTCEILNGFRKMDSKQMMTQFPLVEDRFLQVFQYGFHNVTYYDARRRLKAMNQTDIDHSVAAQLTPEGLWSRLAKTVPLRKS